MDKLEEFKSWLSKEMEARKWSQRELARQAGKDASQTHISLVLSGDRIITWDFCAAIARALDYDPVEVFRIAGLLEATNGNGR